MVGTSGGGTAGGLVPGRQEGNGENGGRVVQARLTFKHPRQHRRQWQPAQHREHGRRVGRREHRAEQQRVPPREAQQPVHAAADDANGHDHADRCQQEGGAHGRPGVRPVSGEAAFGEDQDERAKAEDLGQPGVAELDPGTRFPERQPESQEDQERRQPRAMRQPGRHDRGDDDPRAGQRL
jgi:hypothetical protein